MNDFEAAGLQQLKDQSFPHEQQMGFEKADLHEDATWLDENYDTWHEKMNTHALASFGTFEWVFYRQWLQQNQTRPGAREALDNFERHPAMPQYRDAS